MLHWTRENCIFLFSWGFRNVCLWLLKIKLGGSNLLLFNRDKLFFDPLSLLTWGQFWVRKVSRSCDSPGRLVLCIMLVRTQLLVQAPSLHLLYYCNTQKKNSIKKWWKKKQQNWLSTVKELCNFWKPYCILGLNCWSQNKLWILIFSVNEFCK